jgi:conjugative transfer signal peptidase TraF
MIGRHIVAGSILAVIAVCGAAVAAGVRHNLTPSMPVGFWLKKPLLRPPHVGDIVEACLPSDMPLFEQTRRYVGHGPCPNGLEPVVKTVAAIGDDEVRVEQCGISVNGQALPNTAAMAVDGTGRP